MSKNKNIAILAALCGLSVQCGPALAHHSFAEYDQANAIELQGKLVDIAWQNPHVHFKLLVNGKMWDIESNSLSILRRTNATPESLKAGDTVKMAGWPSKRAPDRLFVTNVLPQNGQELVLDMRSRPRWSATAAGLQTTWLGKGVAANGQATIFTTWATDLGDFSTAFPWLPPDQYPLTVRAKQVFAKWDPVRQTVAPGCRPKGMPSMIEAPYPMEFVDKGDSLLMRMEEYDAVRTIHMRSASDPAKQPKSLQGYSIGRWDGKALVVETSRIDWPFFDTNGVPMLGPEARVVERFSLNADGSVLTDEFTTTDPETFTRPLTLKRIWVRRPGEQVKPYNCVEASPARK
jgi:uncharacterized protein DUF6152